MRLTFLGKIAKARWTYIGYCTKIVRNIQYTSSYVCIVNCQAHLGGPNGTIAAPPV